MTTEQQFRAQLLEQTRQMTENYLRMREDSHAAFQEWCAEHPSAKLQIRKAGFSARVVLPRNSEVAGDGNASRPA